MATLVSLPGGWHRAASTPFVWCDRRQQAWPHEAERAGDACEEQGESASEVPRYGTGALGLGHPLTGL